MLVKRIFNRFRAIARYWLGIATFSYPLVFNAPVGPLGLFPSHWKSGKMLILIKLESWD